MKKIISLALSLAAVICIFAIASVTASAAIKESENNNSYENANSIFSGSTITGTLSERNDADYYLMNVNEKGYITINFSNPVISDSSAQWRITVYKKTDSYVNINSFTVNTIQANSVLPKVGVDAGEYYIVVTDNNYGYASGIEYSLKPVFTETTYWETELNDKYTDADDMKFGQKYGGHIHERSRADFYKISVEENGYITIVFSNPVISSSSAQWSVTVYKYSDELQEIQFYTANPTNAKTTLPKIGVEPGTYYIKVADNNYGYACNIEYGIKTDFTKTDYRETELNDVYTDADKMVTGKKYIGHIHNRNKVDYYEIDVPENGYLGITFTNPVLTDSSAQWAITVYRYVDELQEIQYYTVNTSNAKTVLPKIGVEPGVYYIKVSDNNYGYACNTEYGLQADYVETDYWETENNDNYSVADKMITGKEYGGHIHNRSKTDFYELKFNEKGYFTITFKNPVIQGSSAEWKIKVYKYEDSLKQIQSYDVSINKAVWVLPKIGIEPGTYYIEVCDDNYGYSSNITYSIKTDYVKNNYWESEFNDNYSQADKIVSGVKFGGHIHDRGKTDYYELNVPESTELKITFEHEVLTNSSAEWRIILHKYDNALKKVGDFVSYAKDGKLIAEFYVDSGLYYIQIQDDNYGYSSNVEYGFTVSGVRNSQSAGNLPGDVNFDGQVTAADARLALRASVGLENLSAQQIAVADIDKKSGVTAADARLILRASVGLEKL